MSVPPFPPEEKAAPAVADAAYARGVALAAECDWFAAHEAFEEAWRACGGDERDFFQGLVHAVVAWYQAGRGNRVGFERQRDKARRRLGPFAPAHRGLDVADVLRQLQEAQASYPDLPPLRLSRGRGSRGPR